MELRVDRRASLKEGLEDRAEALEDEGAGTSVPLRTDLSSRG
jgi:hypothetical protein